MQLVSSPAADVSEARSAHGVLPVVLAALVAPPDDPRQFRRYSLSEPAGIGLLPGGEAESGERSPEKRRVQPLASRFSVHARDLSLTGLYFISAVPYRVGLQIEVQLAIRQQMVALPSVVRRLESPARTELGALETAFGCGVHFLQAQMSPAARRALMEYLVGQPG